MQITVELQNDGIGQNASDHRNAGFNIDVQSLADWNGQIAN